MTIPSDKLQHAFFGFIAAAATGCILANTSAGNAATPCLGAFFTAAALAVGKEYGDWAHGDRFDWCDILATVIGGIVGACSGLAALAI